MAVSLSILARSNVRNFSLSIMLVLRRAELAERNDGGAFEGEAIPNVKL